MDSTSQFFVFFIISRLSAEFYRAVGDESLTNQPSRLSDRYAFQKPNDRRALDLMNVAAVGVLNDLAEIVVAYGVSDEYRLVCFVF